MADPWLIANQYPQVDFSMLSKLPELYWQGQAQGRNDQLRQFFANGGKIDDFSKIAALNPELAMKGYAATGDSAFNNYIKMETLKLAQEKASEPTTAQQDAEYFSKLPPGDPRLRFAPRGSAKVLSRPVVNDLAAKGEAVFKTDELASTYKDGYGGYGSSIVGDAANFAARNFGVGNPEAATWWQNYDRQKNVVRHDLFGSALTQTEKQQWEKADINPGMTDRTIRANLAIQTAAVKRAAKRLATVYSRQGVDKQTIEEVLGVPLDELDATPKQSEAPAAAPAPAAPQAAPASGGVVDYQDWLNAQH